MNEICESLDGYINDVSPIFKSKIDNIWNNNELVLNQLLSAYYLSTKLVDDFQFPSDEVYQPLKVLFSKAALSILGIYSCLCNGVITEASSLLRTLFETYVNIKLLVEDDTINRLNLFNNFKYIAKYHHLQSYEKRLENKEITQDEFDKYFDGIDIQLLKDTYLNIKNDYHPKHPKHWAWKIFKNEHKNNPNMWFICNKLGLGDEYQKIYGVNSLSVHSDPLIENLMTTGKSLTIVPFDSEHISRIACVSLDISLKSIVSTIGHFDLEFSEGIERYGDFLFVGACHKDKGR